MIKRGHKPVVDVLAKITDRGKKPWTLYLHVVLLADRTTVRVLTGQTAFYMNYRSEAVLPIELEIPTWRLLNWPEVESRGDLLAMRA